ncbi:hypothetical protein EVAR_27016_1 [Eumeta japonica]|uniref:Uncharacterized protein n=1 Tax=Eumeta variegata TaxID=151549 RepID=A0A4C1WGP7_EUMVA|nr:hypothetical protein EVAR_27016_1 [Eumeta japonica]
MRQTMTHERCRPRKGILNCLKSVQSRLAHGSHSKKRDFDEAADAGSDTRRRLIVTSATPELFIATRYTANIAVAYANGVRVCCFVVQTIRKCSVVPNIACRRRRIVNKAAAATARNEIGSRRAVSRGTCTWFPECAAKNALSDTIQLYPCVQSICRNVPTINPRKLSDVSVSPSALYSSAHATDRHRTVVGVDFAIRIDLGIRSPETFPSTRAGARRVTPVRTRSGPGTRPLF